MGYTNMLSCMLQCHQCRADLMLFLGLVASLMAGSPSLGMQQTGR